MTTSGALSERVRAYAARHDLRPARVLSDLDGRLRLSRERTVHDPRTRRRSLDQLRRLARHVAAGRPGAAGEHLESVAAALDPDP